MTAFLTLAPSASNLAHYTGTMTHLAHLLRHPDAYGLGAPVSAVVIAAAAEAAAGFRNASTFQSILLAAAVPGGHIAVLPRSGRPAFPVRPGTHPPRRRRGDPPDVTVLLV